MVGSVSGRRRAVEQTLALGDPSSDNVNDKMSDHPPARRRVVAAPARRPPAKLRSVRVIVEHDPDPDVSFLEQDEFEERLAAYKRGEFDFVGVVVEAEVLIEDTLQTLRSPELWGVESDSGEEYIVGVAVEEYEQLRKVLKTVGVPTAQLPAADDKQVREWIEWRA